MRLKRSGHVELSTGSIASGLRSPPSGGLARRRGAAACYRSCAGLGPQQRIEAGGANYSGPGRPIHWLARGRVPETACKTDESTDPWALTLATSIPRSMQWSHVSLQRREWLLRTVLGKQLGDSSASVYSDLFAFPAEEGQAGIGRVRFVENTSPWLLRPTAYSQVHIAVSPSGSRAVFVQTRYLSNPRAARDSGLQRNLTSQTKPRYSRTVNSWYFELGTLNSVL